jgi:hypothetical protein
LTDLACIWSSAALISERRTNESADQYQKLLLSGAALFSDGFTNSDISPTPLPAALPFFGAGLGMIGNLTRRMKQKKSAALAA